MRLGRTSARKDKGVRGDVEAARPRLSVTLSHRSFAVSPTIYYQVLSGTCVSMHSHCSIYKRVHETTRLHSAESNPFEPQRFHLVSVSKEAANAANDKIS